ncbi:MAG: lipid-A-disaccharide synthase-related protein [Cyanobacteriota bacterium]|nr:lipid-A-disaccharide synthase-related protein [Cyanobacteriota bacterium]
MSRVLLISNGHGEDLSGARLGQRLIERGVAVDAIPLVGNGGAYREAGVPVLGATREFSTGGLGYTSLSGRLTELRQGQLPYLLRRIWTVGWRRQRWDWVLVVGDVVPLVAGWLSGRPMAVYLVAYSSHYEGRLRLPWPCGWLLRSSRVRLLWSRDALTAEDLTRQLGREVAFVGNPFQEGDPAQRHLPGGGDSGPVLGLLPGSRLPEALANLQLMLEVLGNLPLDWQGRLRIKVALVPTLTLESIQRAAAPLGWSLTPPVKGEASPQLRRGALRLELLLGRFWWVLQQSDLLLAMAGTAAEQAVGLGKPVLQIAGAGPQFTPGFADAQRRLLGPGVSCAAGPTGAPATLAETARMLTAQLERLSDPREGPRWREQLRQVALERLGRPGGTERMVEAIMARLSPVAPAAHATDPR